MICFAGFSHFLYVPFASQKAKLLLVKFRLRLIKTLISDITRILSCFPPTDIISNTDYPIIYNLSIVGTPVLRGWDGNFECTFYREIGGGIDLLDVCHVLPNLFPFRLQINGGSSCISQ